MVEACEEILGLVVEIRRSKKGENVGKMVVWCKQDKVNNLNTLSKLKQIYLK